MITASSIERAKRCPGYVTLPQRNVPTEAASAGTERHAEYEARIARGDIPEALAERWPGATWRSEVKFAFDLSTGKGRELGQGSDRDYSAAGPFEIVGTADVVGMCAGRLVVVDWKSFAEVPRAAVNAQLHIAALALTRAHGLNAADVAIHYEARPMDATELDAIDLDSFAAEVRQILDEAARFRTRAQAGEVVAFAEGSWCKHCPGFYDCPRQKALQEQIERHPALVAAEKAMLPFADDEDAAVAYAFYERARVLVKKLGDALYARASERPIPLGNGKVFGPRTKPGNEKLDGRIAYETVKAKYGPHIAEAAVEMTAAKTRIREALSLAGVKSVAAAEREVIEEIRSKGGSARAERTSFEEYEARAELEKAS